MPREAGADVSGQEEHERMLKLRLEQTLQQRREENIKNREAELGLHSCSSPS